MRPAREDGIVRSCPTLSGLNRGNLSGARMAKPTEQPSPFEVIAFRIPDAVRASGLSRSTLYALAAAGKLNLSRIGGRTLVPRVELERLIAAGQKEFPHNLRSS